MLNYKKKYLILFTIIIILLFTAFVIEENGSQDSLMETTERESADYKINDDIVFVSIPQEEETLEINLSSMEKLILSSSVFDSGGAIPSKYTCDGDNVNPPFEITGVNENVKSLVLIMDDPDAPVGIWDHWVKFNIPVDTKIIEEAGELAGVSGKGTGGALEYSGPCPPDGQHRYFFKLYAIDIELTLAEGSSKEEVEEAIDGHILQSVELMGTYERKIILD